MFFLSVDRNMRNMLITINYSTCLNVPIIFRKWNIISLRETVNISDCAFLSYNSRHNIQRRHWNTDVIQKYYIIKLAIAVVWIVSLAQSSKLISAFILVVCQILLYIQKIILHNFCNTVIQMGTSKFKLPNLK